MSRGSYEDVYELLRQGADPQEADNKGRTPLHFAACRGEVGVGKTSSSCGILLMNTYSTDTCISWCYSEQARQYWQYPFALRLIQMIIIVLPFHSLYCWENWSSDSSAESRFHCNFEFYY